MGKADSTGIHLRGESQSLPYPQPQAKDPKQSLALFREVIKGFGKKLGPILFQLPPAWKVNQERLEEFLAALPKRHRYVFEFRNPTWHTPAILALLRRYNAAFCIFELNGFQSGLHVTANHVYVRLHGPGSAYQGDYSPSTLHEWAERIKLWIGQNRDVFLYFDNDQYGFAAKNAMTMRDMKNEKQCRLLDWRTSRCNIVPHWDGPTRHGMDLQL